MNEQPRAILAGAVDEMLALAQRLGWQIDAVVDPLLDGDWRGLTAFRRDEDAIANFRPKTVILAIDDPMVRRRVDQFYRSNNIRVATLVDGTVDPSTALGEGSVVQVGGVVTTNCRLGRAVRVNLGAVVMHDADVGDYVTIAPRAVILGRVRIGAGAYIGANATVLPDRTVGAGAIVGAGAVVSRDVADGDVVAGIPARVIKKNHRWASDARQQLGLTLLRPIVCVIQARMGSQRLPGKVMMPLAGAPMLQRLIERVQPSHSIDELVVATSMGAENQPIAALCKKLGVRCHRGDENDVLSRFLTIGEETSARTYIRLTGDNPFVDASLVDHVIDVYASGAGSFDYLNNVDESGYPFGLFVEVFSADALLRASADKSAENLEHVTFALRNSGRFRTKVVKAPGPFRYQSLTVDTSEDFSAISKIFENEYSRNPTFGFRDLIDQLHCVARSGSNR